jgi:hypothetical protein
MKLFEYKTEQQRKAYEHQYLHNMGIQGWELVAVVYERGRDPEYYWKREIEPKPMQKATGPRQIHPSDPYFDL